MRILLTGANGFIGRYLVPKLNYQLYITDRGNLDITDHASIKQAFDFFEPNVVVHLAAATGRDLATDPRWVMETNVTATAVIAKLCGQYDARLVYFSSSEAYGDIGDRRVTEESLLGPATNLYGLSKRMGEDVARLYTDPLILRPVMPYGPGFSGTSMYPGHGKCALINFLWKALNDDEIIVHRHTSRSWIYIEDMIDAIVLLIEKNKRGVYNLGVEDDRGMIQLAAYAMKLAGGGRIRVIDPPSNLTKRKFIASEKIMNLGWEPKVSLEEGMKLTLDWLRGEMAQADQATGD